MKKNDYLMLNKIYGKINSHYKSIVTMFHDYGYDLNMGYYKGHYSLLENEYIEEEFPIPVININEVIDIGIEIDYIFLEFYLTKLVALQMEFSFSRNYEIYGLKDFLETIADSKETPEKIKQKLIDSGEDDIALVFTFEYNEDIELILKTIEEIFKYM